MATSGGGMSRLMLVVLLIVNGASGKDTLDTSERFKCPQGWILKGQSCYKPVGVLMPFSDARGSCRLLDARVRVIQNDEENQLFSVSNPGGSYWLGIERFMTGKWGYRTNGTETYVAYTNFNSNQRGQFYYGTCAVWQSQTHVWSMEPCANRHPFMCQKSPVCYPGRFGENCTNQCHCREEACDTTSGLCKHGCQIGWKGEFCNIEKKKAAAKFYCVKAQGRNMMMLRVDQGGTIYRDVSAIDEDGDTVSTCTRAVFSHFEPGGMGTLKVTQIDDGSFSPNCRGNKVSNEDEVISWTFMFREYPSTSTAYDIKFEVKCDFTEANSLDSSTASNTEKPANKSIVLNKSTLSVSLDIIDPANNLSVTSAKLGQEVRLQLKLNNVDDFGVNAISPFNCSVRTLDHRHNVVFTDEHGCSPRDAQIIFLNNDIVTWRSETFETFAFPGYDKLYFRCQYHVCFNDEQTYCRDMCRPSKETNSKRLHRRSLAFTHREEEVAEQLSSLEIV